MKPCWILTTPRTGSTYLCDLLNSTGLFGDKGTCDPSANQIDRWTEYYCPHFFREEYLLRPPVINKIHYEQYRKYFRDFDVSILLDDIKYVLLRRKDVFAITVSKYFVLEGAPFMEDKERWNIHTTEDVNKMKNIRLGFDKQIIMKIHKKSELAYNMWDEFLKDKDFLELEYEDLRRIPSKTTKEVLSWMGLNGNIGISPITMPIRLEHPQKIEFSTKLKKLVEEEYLLL